jgi:hypothetical protein
MSLTLRSSSLRLLNYGFYFVYLYISKVIKNAKLKLASFNCFVFFAILLQINCNGYSCVEGVWHFLNFNLSF